MTAETFALTPTGLKAIILATLGGSRRNGRPDGILGEDLKTKVNEFVERCRRRAGPCQEALRCPAGVVNSGVRPPWAGGSPCTGRRQPGGLHCVAVSVNVRDNSSNMCSTGVGSRQGGGTEGVSGVVRGVVDSDGGHVVRRAVAPVSVRFAVVAARSWREGLVKAGRFAPFCVLVTGSRSWTDQRAIAMALL